jgi:M6 family metalloprotease-like protein
MLRIMSIVRTFLVHVNRRHFWLAVLLSVMQALALSTGTVLAGPVTPVEISLNQPDGTVIVVIPFGDEWSSGYEYQGYTILLNPADGYWVYAKQEKDGNLSLGPWKVGLDQRPTDLLPHLRDPQVTQNKVNQDGPITPQSWHGSSGAQKVVIILVDFTPSTSRGTSDAAWNQLFFDDTAGVKSVRNYYQQASFNQFDLEPASETYGTANDGVIAVTLGYAHPDTYPSGQSNREITSNALIAANAYIDYASFDTNSNGSLDGTELHLVIVARGFEISYGGTASACRPGVWGHRGSLSLSSTPTAPVLDGVTVGAGSYAHGYTQVGEMHEYTGNGCTGSTGHMATMGIMVHELGHDIDWPDLYDTDSTDGSTSAGVGYWSIMAGGSWGRASGSEYVGTTPVLPDAFLKWYQGWLTPVAVTKPMTSVAIPNAADNSVAYLLGTNPGGIDWDFGTASGTGEYFLVENRQLTGFDQGLWRIDNVGNAKGCLIWHVDETRTSSNTANANPVRKLVDVEEANGTQNLDGGTGSNNGDTGDPWPGSSGNTAFNATSTPNSNRYSDALSGIAVTNISTAGTGCTVDFSGVGPAWNGSSDSNWDTFGNWTPGRVPDAYDNVVIPSGVTNWPNLNAAGTAYNINILNGAHLNATADVSLAVSGNWNEEGSGYFDATAGTVTFQGSNPQAITSGASSHFNHLQVGNGTTTQTVTLASDLDVNGNLTIQPNATLALSSYTLHVGGNWTDVPFGFVPGTGTVILDGTTQTVQRAGTEKTVYSNDLSDVTGWLSYDANGIGSDSQGLWSLTTSTNPPNSPNHGQHAKYYASVDKNADDWLFSSSFTLQAGITYTIRFNYGAFNSSYTKRLVVHIGAAQTVGTMTTTLFDNPNINQLTWQPGTGTFTPATSGTYYLGFHALYPYTSLGNIAIDDVSVTTPEPDLRFYNLSVPGTATLDDNTAVQNNLTVVPGGKLTLGTNSLTVEGAITNNGSLVQTKTINSANVEFLHIQNAAASATRYRGMSIDASANSQNLGATTVTLRELNAGEYCTTDGSASPAYATRCYIITPFTSPTADVRVRLYARTADELNGILASNLAVFHKSGALWTELKTNRAAGNDGGSYSYAEGDTSGFSAFLLGKMDAAPTAIQVQNLSGRNAWEMNTLILTALFMLGGVVMLGFKAKIK